MNYEHRKKKINQMILSECKRLVKDIFWVFYSFLFLEIWIRIEFFNLSYQSANLICDYDIDIIYVFLEIDFLILNWDVATI